MRPAFNLLRVEIGSLRHIFSGVWRQVRVLRRMVGRANGSGRDAFSFYRPRPEGFYKKADRLCDADGLGKPHQRLPRPTAIYSCLCRKASHAGGRAINFRWVFAGESTAAMRRRASVGVHDHLAPSQPGLAFRATCPEAAGGVNPCAKAAAAQALRHNRADDRLQNSIPQFA